MKRTILLLVLFTTMAQAQEFRQVPMVNVSGEGKVKVVPDQVSLLISVESKGSKATEVKKENDTKIDVVLKTLKSFNIAKEDFQTQRVALYPNYDYDRKKYNYVATQTVSVLLKDITKYDVLMEALVSTGINRIDNVEFKSSKILQLQSEARSLAVKDAKAKAGDFASALGQKVGKAYNISDNSQGYYPPRPVMYDKAMAVSDESAAPRETLAVGEMEVIVNVNVGFVLE